ncbi:MAG: LysM peptidoglycan-binding domain-containing protein [Bacillota bacterium]
MKKIAVRFGVSPQHLCRYNHLPYPCHWLNQGQILCIPWPGFSPPLAAGRPGENLTYTVQPKENLSLVAEKFGLCPETVLLANSFTHPSQVFPGQIINIPVNCPLPEEVPEQLREPEVIFHNDWCMLFWNGGVLHSAVPLYIAEINLTESRSSWSENPDRWEIKIFVNGMEAARLLPGPAASPAPHGATLPAGYAFVFRSELPLSAIEPFRNGACYVEALAFYLPRQFFLWQELPYR